SGEVTLTISEEPVVALASGVSCDIDAVALREETCAAEGESCVGFEQTTVCAVPSTLGTGATCVPFDTSAVCAESEMCVVTGEVGSCAEPVGALSGVREGGIDNTDPIYLRPSSGCGGPSGSAYLYEAFDVVNLGAAEAVVVLET